MKKLGLYVSMIVVVLALTLWSGVLSFLLSTHYLPHQYCYLAQPWLIWTNVITDALIAISYGWIFFELLRTHYRLKHILNHPTYLGILAAFGTFILACGVTHLMSILTIWWPVYRLAAFANIICAAASLPTAIVFSRIAPTLSVNLRAYLETLNTTRAQKDQALATLIASEKLAVAGRVSASIAHEIRSPLESIGNLLYLLRSDPALPPELRAYVETAEGELYRAGGIVKNTLGLYRESDRPISLSLETLVLDVLALQSPFFLANNITIETRLRCPVPVTGYPGELRQLVINLLQNAAEAIGSNGRIQVRVQLRSDLQTRQSGYSITIADNGIGMSPEHVANLYTLFFTTKGEKGTGVGLWLVKSIIEKHGGHVRTRSRQRDHSAHFGTVFNIWLPLGDSTQD